jgi:hypothetical protein
MLYLNNFCGPSHLSTEVLPMNCKNLQIISNLSKEMTGAEIGATTTS